VLVHKLRVPDLARAPRIEDAIDLVFEAIAGCVPVFHTGAVERAFLSKPFSRRRVQLPEAADTEVLGRAWLRRRDGAAPASLTLARLSRELGMPAETPHHALGDALTTAEAFVTLATHLDAVERQTVGSLVGSLRTAAGNGPAPTG
jgi:DNA polymerase III epsilon subunit-like protein